MKPDSAMTSPGLLDDDFLRFDGPLDWTIGVARAGVERAVRLYGVDAVAWSAVDVIRTADGGMRVSVRGLEAIARCLTAVTWTAGVQMVSQQIGEALGERRHAELWGNRRGGRGVAGLGSSGREEADRGDCHSIAERLWVLPGGRGYVARRARPICR
jgi:hypothetical protein